MAAICKMPDGTTQRHTLSLAMGMSARHECTIIEVEPRTPKNSRPDPAVVAQVCAERARDAADEATKAAKAAKAAKGDRKIGASETIE